MTATETNAYTNKYEVETNGTVIPVVIANEDDLDDVYGIIQECSTWLKSSGMNHWADYYTREKILEKLQSPSSNTFVIRESETPVATITLGTKPPEYYTVNTENENHMSKFKNPESAALYVTALGVKPKFQGKGYAKALIKFAEEHAKKQEIEWIRFDARGDYLKLIAFYKSLGYEIVGEMPDVDSPYHLFEKHIAL